MRTSYNAKTLFVDLSDKRAWVETLPDYYSCEYLGGRGAAARLLWDMTNAKTEPLGKNSVLIFSPGSLTGTSAPTSGRTTVTFKSPATGGYFKSSVGGSIGFALKNSGYDHVVIRGKAKSPVYLYVAVDRIEIRDAQHVWGANVIETNRQIKSEMENDELRIACIGVAGETLCNFASIMGTYYTAAARGGGGAVMGSKKLKALVVNPAGGKIYVSNPKQFTAAVQRAREASLADSHAMEMKLWGTSTSTDQMALAGLLPTYNYKRQWLQSGHGNLTGRHLQEEGYLKRSVGCSSCLFGCHRFTEINQGPYKGTYSQGPEYETFASLGGNLGITDSQVILKANAIANERGFDVISLGSVVGWAIESYENGLLSEEDTGGKELKWEDGETLFFLIDAISKREGIGDLLADGVRIASKKIGGGSYKWAIQARGLEQSRVELRGAFSYALAFALNPRGPDHLTTEALAEFGTGYTVEAPGIIKKITGSEEYAHPYLLEKRAEIVTWHENIYAVSDSLGYCAFATTACYGLDEKILSDTFNSATGLALSPLQIMEAGRRIVTLERCYNLREGWSRACDTLPWRIMNEKAVDLDQRQPVDAVMSHEMLDKMLDDYYAINHWDPQNGFPTEETLKALSLEFAIPELREKRSTAMDYLPESCREE
jgi:aldehyde:ferredoxin oxidoreductase